MKSRTRTLVGAAMLLAACNPSCLGLLSGGPGDNPIDSDFEADPEAALHPWSTWGGDAAITTTEVHSGRAALSWSYTVKDSSVTFLAKNELDPQQFRGSSGIRLWGKSNKTGAMMFHALEVDGSTYQYMTPGAPFTPQWQQFDLPFDGFELDTDGYDENDRLDVDQIKEFWVVDVAGYFDKSLVGPRTVWLDDIELVGGGMITSAASTDPSEVIPSGPSDAINNWKSDPTVLLEDGLFKMWYGANRSGKGHQLFYATSTDGRNWDLRKNPVMTLGPSGAWDAGDLETPTVVRARGMYHMWYCGREVSYDGDEWRRESAYEIGHATSADGIHWTKNPANPVIKLGNKGRNDWNWAAACEPTALYDAKRDLFELWYVGINILGGAAHAHIGYVSSRDGVHWEPHPQNPVIASRPASGDKGFNGYLVPEVVKDGDEYVLLYVSDNTNGFPLGPIRVATSPDGVHWRMNRKVVLSAGPPSSWRGSGVFGPTAVIDQKNVHLFYTGRLLTTRFRFGIGYEKLPRDVFRTNLR